MDQVLPGLVSHEQRLVFCMKQLKIETNAGNNACGDALNKLGPVPWSEDKIGQVCDALSQRANWPPYSHSAIFLDCLVFVKTTTTLISLSLYLSLSLSII